MTAFVLGTVVLAGSACRVENYTDPSGPRFGADYAVSPSSSGETLRIVTFNLKVGRDIAGAGDELAEQPELRDADLLLMQEMGADGVDQLARRLSYNYVYYPANQSDNGGFGNAVLSRWPIVADHKLLLPHRSAVNDRLRIAVGATIDTPGGSLSCYSVHLDTPWLGPRARLDQARAVLTDAAESSLPTVIGGDFNTSDPGAVSHIIGLFLDAGYGWATRELKETADASIFDKQLDHVLVRGLTPLEAGVVETEASDHHVVWTVLAAGAQ